jgi:hypothetical protein
MLTLRENRRTRARPTPSNVRPSPETGGRFREFTPNARPDARMIMADIAQVQVSALTASHRVDA